MKVCVKYKKKNLSILKKSIRLPPNFEFAAFRPLFLARASEFNSDICLHISLSGDLVDIYIKISIK